MKHEYMTNPIILYFNVMDHENYYQFYDILKIKKQTIVFLDGDIGAGKTTFVKSFSKKFSNQNIHSPTFSLINEYTTPKFKIFHYDLYRINSTQELFEIGIDNYFLQDGLHFIEWASNYINFLPHPDYRIEFLNYDPYRILKVIDYANKK